jgi:hypothetical protein
MGISHKYRSVFVCIPKNATSTISNRLLNQTDQSVHSHDTYMDIIGQNDNDLMDSYYSFTFVRDPLDRAVSIYHQLSRSYDEVQRLDFKQFVEHIPDTKITGHASFGWSHDVCLRAQFRFVSIKNVVLVDDVFRFEDITSDWAKCVQRINANLGNVGYSMAVGKLPKENSSDRLFDLSAYYDQSTFDRVVELYKKDFDMFGYPKVLKDAQGNVVYSA